MNYEILRHINNLYDHVEILNSQIETLNRQNIRGPRLSDPTRSFYYENPVYIPPLYDLPPRRTFNSSQLLSDMRTRLNTRINRLNQETQNLNSANTHPYVWYSISKNLAELYQCPGEYITLLPQIVLANVSPIILPVYHTCSIARRPGAGS